MAFYITRLIFLIAGLLITIGILSFILYILAPVDASRESSKVLAVEFCNVINSMLNAPNNTIKNLYLPEVYCSIKIEDDYVNVTTNESYSMTFIIPDEEVVIDADNIITCLKTDRQLVVFKKIVKKDSSDVLEIKMA